MKLTKLFLNIHVSNEANPIIEQNQRISYTSVTPLLQSPSLVLSRLSIPSKCYTCSPIKKKFAKLHKKRQFSTLNDCNTNYSNE